MILFLTMLLLMNLYSSAFDYTTFKKDFGLTEKNNLSFYYKNFIKELVESCKEQKEHRSSSRRGKHIPKNDKLNMTGKRKKVFNCDDDTSVSYLKTSSSSFKSILNWDLQNHENIDFFVERYHIIKDNMKKCSVSEAVSVETRNACLNYYRYFDQDFKTQYYLPDQEANKQKESGRNYHDIEEIVTESFDTEKKVIKRTKFIVMERMNCSDCLKSDILNEFVSRK